MVLIAEFLHCILSTKKEVIQSHDRYLNLVWTCSVRNQTCNTMFTNHCQYIQHNPSKYEWNTCINLYLLSAKVANCTQKINFMHLLLTLIWNSQMPCRANFTLRLDLNWEGKWNISDRVPPLKCIYPILPTPYIFFSCSQMKN